MTRAAVGFASIFVIGIAIAPLLVDTHRIEVPEARAKAQPSLPNRPRTGRLQCNPDLSCTVRRGDAVAVLK